MVFCYGKFFSLDKSLLMGDPITFAITGSKKWCAEGVPLFAVRVDGVVIFQIDHTEGQTLNWHEDP